MVSPRCSPRRSRLLAAAAASVAVGMGLSGQVVSASQAQAPATMLLNVAPVHQVHNLDCEAAALQMALAGVGINVTQDRIIAQVGDDPRPPTGPPGAPTHWGDPNTAFVGSVNGRMMYTGYGVYGPPIAAAARSLGALATAEVNVTPAALYASVASGTLAVVWVTHLLIPPSVGQWIAFDGAPVWYSPEEHAQAVVGVNMAAGTVTLADPWDGLLHTYAMPLFEARFAAFHGTAVFVAPLDGPSVIATTPPSGQGIFWKGASGGLWDAFGNGETPGAAAEVSATGMASAPGVALTSLGQRVVFWRGTDDLLREMWWQSGVWSGPVLVSTAALMASAPAVLVTPGGQQAVFWQAPGGHLEEAWWDPGHGWNGPIAVAGSGGMSSAPTGFVTAGGQQAILWRAGDGNRVEVWWDPGDLLWHGPVGVTTGAPMNSGPSAAVLADGQQVVFWEGRDSSLNETWWGPSAGWSRPVSWGAFGSIASTPSVDVEGPAQTQTVYWKGPDGNVWAVQFSGGAWAAPTDLKLGPIG